MVESEGQLDKHFGLPKKKTDQTLLPIAGLPFINGKERDTGSVQKYPRRHYSMGHRGGVCCLNVMSSHLSERCRMGKTHFLHHLDKATYPHGVLFLLKVSVA